MLSRRQLFQLGGLTISGFGLVPFTQINVQAAAKVQPRGGADCVIFLNLQGGPSQMDTFDVKEGKWGPENRDIRTVKQGYQFPYGFLPRLANHLDDILVVRSMEAWETVHSRGQFYLQTGHAPSPARMKEMPSLGAIIASETEPNRQPSDFLPPYVSMNYAAGTMYGPMQGEGCLPGTCAPLTLDLADKSLPFVIAERDKARFHNRYELLQQLDTGAAALSPASPQQPLLYQAFRDSAYRMMVEPRIAQVMDLPETDRKAYGSTPLGDACIIARNMAAAKAGAKFIMVTQPGWDHHGDIYGKDGKGGLYKTCADLDAAFAALLSDLKRFNLLERTLVVCMGEFGRTPGDLTTLRGREHYAKAMIATFSGAGVKAGRVIGATDEQAAKVVDYGWREKRAIYPEDICATIYSTLGIDWSKRITKTPSGRDFVYVDPAGPQGLINYREVSEFFA